MYMGHGADLKQSLKKYQLESLEDYSSNVNIFHSDKVETILRSISPKDLSVYPDIEYTDLRGKISQRYGIQSEQIIVGNGSTEIIFAVMGLDAVQTVGIINPTFSEYARAAELSGKDIVNFYYDQDFGIDVDAINLEKIDILFVCNPNNPSGNLNPLGDLLEKCKKHNTILFVDETFMEFTGKGEYSLLEKVQACEHLFVLKAVTKFHSLTGVRLGYGFSSKQIISELWTKKQPWTINVFAEKLVDVIFDDEFERKTVDFFQAEIPWYENQLKAMENIKVYPTTSNYFLLKIKSGLLADQVKERLIKNHGILIRDCSNYKGLDNTHIRVNIKSRESNLRLLEALKKELSNE